MDLVHLCSEPPCKLYVTCIRSILTTRIIHTILRYNYLINNVQKYLTIYKKYHNAGAAEFQKSFNQDEIKGHWGNRECSGGGRGIESSPGRVQLMRPELDTGCRAIGRIIIKL